MVFGWTAGHLDGWTFGREVLVYAEVVFLIEQKPVSSCREKRFLLFVGPLDGCTSGWTDGRTIWTAGQPKNVDDWAPERLDGFSAARPVGWMAGRLDGRTAGHCEQTYTVGVWTLLKGVRLDGWAAGRVGCWMAGHCGRPYTVDSWTPVFGVRYECRTAGRRDGRTAGRPDGD